jgi:hypothetical protein
MNFCSPVDRKSPASPMADEPPETAVFAIIGLLDESLYP